MLLSLEVRTRRPQVEGTVPERRMSFISVAFLNRGFLLTPRKYPYYGAIF